MANYTETFTSVSGDSVDASELETQFDAISTAIATKLDSDGSGTMTGALKMGSNKVETVTDPTAAQDAATKNYVDTSEVSDYDTLAVGTGISTTETVISTLAITVPSDWATYDLEVLASVVFVYNSGTPTGDTICTLFARETGLGGTLIAQTQDVLNGSGAAGVSSNCLYGYQVADNRKGARTVVVSSKANTNNIVYQTQYAKFRVRARRVT